MNKTTKPAASRLILRTLAMPADTNPTGDIFGGWIMSQMDIAGGMLAREITRTRIVTAAVDSIRFIKPVSVGDTVCCYGKVLKIGRTSITINLEVWVKHGYDNPGASLEDEQVTKAAFTYVTVNSNGEKIEIDKSNLC